jgi:hypothetical protein
VVTAFFITFLMGRRSSDMLRRFFFLLFFLRVGLRAAFFFGDPIGNSFSVDGT